MPSENNVPLDSILSDPNAISNTKARLNELSDIYEKRLRNAEDLINKDISYLFKSNKAPTRDAIVNAFKEGFIKKYELSDRAAEVEKFVTEKMLPSLDAYFASGSFDVDYAETKARAAMSVAFRDSELVLNAKGQAGMLEGFEGIKTLRDLITKYSQAFEQLKGAGAKDAVIAADAAELEAAKKKLLDLESRIDKKVAESKPSELEMHKILEAMDKYSQAIPSAVRINFYKTYLNLKPQNEVLKGIVLYNIGCAYMNDLQKDETAFSYFKKALEISKKEYAANPGSPDAERRRVKYQCGLEACEENIRKAKKVVLLPV